MVMKKKRVSRKPLKEIRNQGQHDDISLRGPFAKDRKVEMEWVDETKKPKRERKEI